MICWRCGGLTAREDLLCPRCGAPQYPSAGSAPPTPPARRDRHRSALLAVGIVAAIVAASGGVAAALLITGHRSGRPTAAATTPATSPTAARSSSSASPSPSPTPTPSPTPAADFGRLFARERSGVVRIETVGCSNAGVGTGFLLSPTLVATVNHVVAQSVVVSVMSGAQRTTGTVIGADPAHDLALIKASRPLPGHEFRFATRMPRRGEQVAAVGFPVGGPVTLTHGEISGSNGDGARPAGMLETSAVINPGNSGGPLVAGDGRVVGLVDATSGGADGTAYAVPATRADPAMARWQQRPAPVPPGSCPNPHGPAQERPKVPALGGDGITSAEAEGVTAAFDAYFGAIDTGDYAAAYAVLSPRSQSYGSEREFADGLSTTYDFDIHALGAAKAGPGTVQVGLSFTSLQVSAKGPAGETCDVWTIDYTVIQADDGRWLIDAAKPHGGALHKQC